MKPIAFFLAGCGHRDGAEVSESVLLALALSEREVEVRWFAPDVDVFAIDHVTRTDTGERRNALREAARIARGRISPTADFVLDDVAGLAFSGGSGTGKVLFTFKADGARCRVDPIVAAAITGCAAARKPIIATGLGAALPGVVLGRAGRKPVVCLGPHPAKLEALRELGATHRDADLHDCVIDPDNLLVTTPAYLHRPAEPPLRGVMRGVRAACDVYAAWLREETRA